MVEKTPRLDCCFFFHLSIPMILWMELAFRRGGMFWWSSSMKELYECICNKCKYIYIRNTHVIWIFVCMSCPLLRVFIFTVPHHTDRGLKWVAHPKRFFGGAVKRCCKICDTLGNLFGEPFFQKNFAKEGSVKKMVALWQFFPTPNQPADFKCSKQPIIYYDAVSCRLDLK